MELLAKELSMIDGIGVHKARELILAGVSSLEQLQEEKYQQMLSEEARLSIKYKVEPLLEYAYVDRLIKLLPNNLVCVGSYRRKKETLGDIDLLTKNSLENVVESIKKLKEPMLIGEYAAGERKRSILLKFEGKYTRVDIFRATEEEWPFSLLHFTGSRAFNIRVRAQAKRKGCKLSQYDLVCDGKKIPCANEKEILEAIGITYKEPEDRNE